MIESYFIVLFLFISFVLFFNYKEVKRSRVQSPEDRKYILWTQIAILAGVLLRTIDLSIPSGIFIDEAISGYDSWCLAYYGVDQHLLSYPVYLKSWGTGQSAVYSYLGIPFVKLFGLSVPVYRLPMALVSCTSLIVLYYTLRRTQQNTFLTFIIILLFIISPWHIMKSRWALDCNLSPDFALIGVCLFVLGYYTYSYKIKKGALYYPGGCAFLSLAAYSYGVSWFMLPLFVVFLFIFLYKSKKINLLQTGYCLLFMLILLFPLILFAYNLLIAKGEAFTMGGVTIPSLGESRHNDTTILGSRYYLGYIMRGISMLFTGDDGLPWNSMRYIGQFYNLVGMPFIIWALTALARSRKLNIYDSVFGLWLIATIPVLFLVTPNVNHWNLIWFPLIYFAGRGLFFCLEKTEKFRYVAIGCICLLTILFGIKYIDRFGENNLSAGFNKNYDKLQEFSNNKDFDSIYYPGGTVYVTPLFYNPVDPYKFNQSKSGEGGGIKKYDKYHLYTPLQIKPLPKTLYIFSSGDLDMQNIDSTKFKIERINEFTLLWND
jgi:hypothetical protein